MWKSLFAILCTAGTVLAYYEPQSVLVHAPPPPRNVTKNTQPKKVLKGFSCPQGFERSKRICFYISAGKANWQEAHFFCKDRNATLATLPRKHMDRKLRDLLADPKFPQVERWIGARYNWGDSAWEWGVVGKKITYEGFSKLRSGNDQLYRWHCAALNPERQYRWAARSCLENKQYVCTRPAIRLGKARRTKQRGGRKMKTPQKNNGTLSRDLYDENAIIPYTIKPSWRRTRKSRPIWDKGIKPGMRPFASSRTRWAPGTKFSDRLHLVKGTKPGEPDQWVGGPKPVSEISKNRLEMPVKEFSVETLLLDVSPTAPMTLAAEGVNTLNQLGGEMSNMWDEEVLLKT